MAFRDLTGIRFSRLLVLGRDYTKKPGQTGWHCVCDCGKFSRVSASHLNSGHTKSCGCLHAEAVNESLAVDISGQKFGMLTALSPVDERSRDRRVRWMCRCDCGGFTTVPATALKSGNTRSCKCLRDKNFENVSVGAWLVLRRAQNRKNRKMWLCKNQKTGEVRIRASAALAIESDPNQKFLRACRCRVLGIFRRRSTSKECSTARLLGCTGAELAVYLSSRFKPGMTLENHGEWEIDHIKPISSFDLTDTSQVSACFHHSNLQPLWVSENRKKWKSY